MTERRWTSGPWRRGQRHYSIVSDSKTGHDDDLSVKAYAGHLVAESVSDENADLMIAAPDLYEALDVMLQQWVELAECGDAGYWDANQDVSVIQARAALAKARGEK